MKENKKYYLIYQVTNNVNGKIYIGMHETNDLEDDYMGSGKLLRYAKEKYGIENFTFKVLMFLQNREEMQLLEHYVVTPEFCSRKDVYNLNEGGSGGWNYVNLSSDYVAGSEKRHNAAMKANSLNEEAKIRRVVTVTQTRQNWSEDQKINNSRHISAGIKKHKLIDPTYMVGENNPMFNRRHTTKSKAAMSENHIGERNSSYGKHWWTNPETFEMKLLRDNEVPEGWFRKSNILNEKKQEILLSQKLKEEKIVGELPIRTELVEQIMKMNNTLRVNVLMTISDLQLILDKLSNPQNEVLSSNKYIQTQLNKIDNQYKREQKIKLINELYPIYCKYGWEEVLKIHPFKCSVFAFIQTCKKYAKRYDPLNRRNKRFPITE